MKRIKSILVIALMMLTVFSLAGCGSNKDNAGNSDKETTLKIGATPVPHKEILEFAKPILKQKGVNLEIVEFTDYILPNKALANKELDANYFQHAPYLETFNKDNNLDLTYTIKVHFEPMGIYPGKVKSLDKLSNNDKVAVPNDPTNEARALLLLEKADLIKVKAGAGLKATKKDIIENKNNLDIQELDASQIPRALPDVAIAVINGNYAVQAGLKAGKDALISEDKNSEAANTFGNIIAVRKGDENKEAIKILDEVLKSAEVKKFIEDKYEGAVVPLS